MTLFNEIHILEDLERTQKIRRLSRMSKMNIMRQMYAINAKNRNKRRAIASSVLLKNQKLSDRMQCVTDKLDLQFQLEIPKERPPIKKINPQRQFIYATEEELLTIKSNIFKILHQQDYTKIEDMLKRFYITTENLQTDKGDSLLTMAVNMGDYKMVNLMLFRGLDPNTQNHQGDTPLHFAINKMDLRLADLLIDYGANEKIKNKAGQTPWEVQKLR